MASSSINDLTPDTKSRAVAFMAAANAAGLTVSMGRTRVSCAEQGMNTAPIMVNGLPLKRAPSCRSWHVWGRAFDIVLASPTTDRYAQLGALGKSFGLQWGGDFKTNYDPIHFQFTGGLDITKLCPDPMKCDDALRAAGQDAPLPILSSASPGLLIPWSLFALATTAGFWVARKFRKG
jgi:hypothetical protein